MSTPLKSIVRQVLNPPGRPVGKSSLVSYRKVTKRKFKVNPLKRLIELNKNRLTSSSTKAKKTVQETT
jgi:hypothetical protein